MLVLAIECCTQVASVALFEGSAVLAELSSPDPKAHSEFINPAIGQVLKSANKNLDDVELFAVDVGPGSFTGIRVAINVARTFSFLKNKPVYTRKSLHLLLDQTPKDALAIINAYKNMVFVSVHLAGAGYTPPEVVPVEGLAAYLNQQSVRSPILALGDGFKSYAAYFPESVSKLLIRSDDLSDFPSAAILARQALSNKPDAKDQTFDWKSVIPLYLRASAAEENLRSK